MQRGDLGALLDSIAAFVFLFFALSRTALIGKFSGLTHPSKYLWLSSAGGFFASLTALVVISVPTSALIVGLAGTFGTSSWPIGVVGIAAFLIFLLLPGYFTERRILAKSGMERLTASRLSLYSSAFLFVLVNVLIYVCYVIAMRCF